jgi:hypothetical protein
LGGLGFENIKSTVSVNGRPFYDNPKLVTSMAEKSPRDQSIINFIAFELGILSRRKKDMFAFSNEDEKGIPLPSNPKFKDLFAVRKNIAVEAEGLPTIRYQRAPVVSYNYFLVLIYLK